MIFVWPFCTVTVTQCAILQQIWLIFHISYLLALLDLRHSRKSWDLIDGGTSYKNFLTTVFLLCDNRSESTDFKEKFSSERRTPEKCFVPDVTTDILADMRKEDVGQPNIPVTLARIIVQSATFSLTLPHFLLKAQCTLASFFTESAFLNLGFPYFLSSPIFFAIQ